MKRFAVAALLLAACSSKPTPPVTAPPDTRLADLQASMTEMLERLDVMNDRITRLEKAGEEKSVAADSSIGRPVEKPASTQIRQHTVAAASIADTYRNAIALYSKNSFVEARAAFQKVFDADASGELADNALFWIGETYFAAGDYNNAIRFYKRVAEEYGDQNKAPDAMYKLAVAYEKTSDLALARTTLQEVIARYPYSAPAVSAKSELNRIKY